MKGREERSPVFAQGRPGGSGAHLGGIRGGGGGEGKIIRKLRSTADKGQVTICHEIRFLAGGRSFRHDKTRELRASNLALFITEKGDNNNRQ